MSKQTSIEWLIEQLEPAIALQSKHIDKIEKEAIEMHARDMIDFITWIGGSYSFGNVLGLWYEHMNTDRQYTASQLYMKYYKETYGNGE
jgi:hypothetical protein